MINETPEEKKARIKKARQENISRIRAKRAEKQAKPGQPEQAVGVVKTEVIEKVEAEVEAEKKKAGQKFSFRWLLLLPATLSIIFGIRLMMAWGADRQNTVLGFGVIFIPMGIWLAYWVLSGREDKTVIVLPGGSQVFEGKANALNIYAQRNPDSGRMIPDRIEFAWMDKALLLGQPQQCVNNGNWYHVHIWDAEKNRLKALILPDSQYYDPDEFANVLTMPAHRKLFAQQASLFQRIAIGFLVLALLISGIILIVVSSPPPVA